MTRAPSVPGSVAAGTERTHKVGIDYPTDWARRTPARVVRKVLHETVVAADGPRALPGPRCTPRTG